MATITDIYKKYGIDRNLQLHQLRVAAVAKQICDSLTVSVDKDTVITVCLIHDMGNILKYDFSKPELLEPEGVEYWQKFQKEFAKKFNTQNEHEASLKIARELGVSQPVIDCIESISFSKTVQTAASDNLEIKICDNADLRVDPKGIVSLNQRLEEGKQRYKNRPNYWISRDDQEKLYSACHEIEDQIFQHSIIKPSDITNESVAPIIENLKSYEI